MKNEENIGHIVQENQITSLSLTYKISIVSWVIIYQGNQRNPKALIKIKEIIKNQEFLN